MYRIGRTTGKKTEHAFDLEPLGGGGIRITNITKLSDPERTIVMAHFGRSIRARVAHSTGQHFRVFDPGSKDHFKQCAYHMPTPFALMGTT